MEEKQVRGFSFRPNTDVDLQYVLGDELKSMWAASKRERSKIQESKIWDEFCKERDVISQVLEDDPYQFLEEYTARDLLIGYPKEAESKKTVPKDNVVIFGSGEPYSPARKTVNFFSSPTNQADEESYHIDKDKQAVDTRPQVISVDKPDNIITLEEEGPNDIICEKPSIVNLAVEPQDAGKVETSIDSECNEEVVLTTSESELSNRPPVPAKHADKPDILHNIYYVRLKDHRKKIVETLQSILALLQTHEYEMEDPLQVYKLEKRSSEFSARFTRTHMYQLRTQLQDLKRSMKMSLPFGKRTLFQTQMPKVVSLHQNSLQALQVFAKSLESAPCLSDCGHHLSAMLLCLKETTAGCAELIATCVDDGSQSAELICSDGLLTLCDQVEEELTLFTEKMVLTARLASSRSSKKHQQRKSPGNPYEKSSGHNIKRGGSKVLHCIESGLSMYSAKVKSSNDSSKSSAFRRLSAAPSLQPKVSVVDAKRQLHSRSAAQPKKLEEAEVKRSPGYGRKPLMRNPDKGKHCVRRQKPKEDDIKTMVEALPILDSPAAHKQETIRTPAISPHKQEDIRTPAISPRKQKSEKKPADERAGQQVERLLNQLCGGDERPANARSKTSSASRNAQLICVKEISSPKQLLTTPSLLKVLEDSIQKKPTKPELCYQYEFQSLPEDVRNKLLLTFNLPEDVQTKYTEYRKSFAQHMIGSPMYANIAIDRPWEAVARTSDVIMDEILLGLAKEMNFDEELQQMYLMETK